MNLLRHLFTGQDNTTWDLGRISWGASFGVLSSAGVWNAMHGQTFDLVQVATAFSAVAGAHAGALWAKRDTEPKP